MAGGGALLIHIVASFFVIPAVLVGILTNEWYVVLSLVKSFKFGLTQTCDESGCYSNDYDRMAEITANHCSRDPSAINSRFTAVLALLAIAVIFAVIQTVMPTVQWVCNAFYKIPNIIHVTVTVITFLAVIVSVVLFMMTVELWMFCDKSYCKMAEEEYIECSNNIGYSFTGPCCALAFALVALVSLIFSLCTRETAVVDEDEVNRRRAEKQRSVDQVNNERHREKASRSRAGASSSPNLPAELQGGDWEFDEESSYFWSEEKQLFFEPDTKQFYDPHSEHWYNPDTGAWYQAEE
eukprot:TRINITY_DN3022_c0_g1_i1.p1 TRINITY_DN3022_c0_g1~~TRINITY_DN3022_c0_g1_i1.p1  ORF type:complete len:295 (+),score=57.62 TRINITY_DN3022_c0_g1_i1:209-1093(+)